MSGERLKSRRPSLGPLAQVALAAWCAAALSESITWRLYAGQLELPPQLPVLLALVIATLAVLCLLLLKKTGINAFPALLAGVAVATSGCLYWHAWASNVESAQQLVQQGALTVELTDDGVERDYGRVSAARVVGKGDGEKLRVLWPEDCEVPSAGHLVELEGSLSVPEDSDGGRWNHQNGYVGMLCATSAKEAGYAASLRGAVCKARDSAFERIESLGGDGAGILAGILLGNRTLYAGTETEQAFRVCGLAHLMAVSGTHLAVITVIASWLLACTPAPRRLRVPLLATLLGGYVALTGFAPSALRSCAMCLVASASGLGLRRGHGLTGLWLCILMFLGIWPDLAFSVGYQLSVLAMLGLMLLSPLFADWLKLLLPKRLHVLADPLAATLAATAPTLAVTLPTFNQLPLISPLSTLLASPLITAALGLGIVALCACLPLPGVGTLLLKLAAAIADACACLVGLLAKVPGACIPFDAQGLPIGPVVVGLFALLWVLWPLPPEKGARPRVRFKTAAAFALPLVALIYGGFGGITGVANVVTPAVTSDAQVVQLDVGQGDAMLIRDADAAVLIDTGEDPSLLLPALARYGISHLDAVILSHKDIDHTGALSSLAGVVSVDHVYIHKDLLAYEGEADVLEAARRVCGGAEGVKVGSKITVGRFFLEVLAPEVGGEGENEDSLVSLVTFCANDDDSGEVRLLVSGDGEAEVLSQVAAQVGDIDIVKAPHHGSKGGFTQELLATLRPEVALISVGADNSYGHPNQETLTLLEQAESVIYRTDLNGDIAINFASGNFSVSTQK